MENLLECPICCLSYDDKKNLPRALSCQHIFCTNCLELYIKEKAKSNLIECPICKSKCSSNINDIPRSLVTLQLIEATKQLSISRPSSNTNTYNQLPSNSNTNPFSLNNQIANNSKNPFNNYNNQQFSHYPQNSYPQYNVNSASNTNMQTPTTFNPFNNQSNIGNMNRYQQQQQQGPPLPPLPAKIPEVPIRPVKKWSLKDYLKSIFDQIDINRDGGITANELQKALKNVQSSSDFSLKTVDLIMRKYDLNGDGEISFEEFFDLYNNLNEELETFLIMDQDGSGYIDNDEFENALKMKGYTFTKQFFDGFLKEICRHTNSKGIQFDTYIRVAARFDYLCQQYHNTSYYKQNYSLETYLAKTFFQDFW